MKKFFLLTAMFFSFAGYSQFHIGAKAGANMNKLDGQAFDDGFEFGYQLGGFVYFNLTDFIGLQGEVLFNQTNTKLSNDYRDVFDNVFKKDKTLNYVSVPVLLRLNSEGLITIVTGPQFSFLANTDHSVSQNGKKLFKNTDFSFVAGAEVNIRPLTLYARYVWGFSDVSNFGDKANSQQIQAGLGLRLF
ncbi:hypothetical protein B0A67_15710 [Flavobacterium aquidurense]|uniref:porin family protein n=1 Tax=Flavobacterium aquidurense TaxID=362413 RepID=UPI000913C093|nr:porin family protein [Flavobacterium aquidurense]OXA70461.1 hypothetical protein B0A67_15710 [Flavobacterium aquidurense]SHH73060.1 Outer membrane protein beta-barrel domain-containing protein [Flavobacterium frigidimaris]